ncbi:MAG: lasso RiPP family leader peptide-containing protein [Deltaproteobacteria bacterium]|nr:lasso RiPP family leader peptide-containing protein [Deltaproteobacteria bacterium]MBW1819436.1 lasso RiPP family leader peptide-containing protein [Deltaproteobacteria bacterium]MBW2284113.1 lasso RiPP family leader peptide-containing protein [Deltaproteobacteria bacterium]
MEERKNQVDSSKKVYEKPVLSKHGNLKEVTGHGLLATKKSNSLGCTRF